MPTVYVVSEPLVHRGGRWTRKFDLGPARAHGELRFLLPPNNEAGEDHARICQTLADGLRDFCRDDSLLLTGNPLFIAWAAMLAAGRCEAVALLRWDADLRAYERVTTPALATAPALR